MSVKQQAAKGMMWNAIERFSTQGIHFVLTIILARLLSPADYGLVAMLTIFMAVAQTLIDSGFSNALIQKKNRTETDYNTMFYFNIAISFLIYLLLFVSAPWIADFYNQPELVKVTRVYFIYLITNSFGTIQMTRFTIMLDFKKLAYASLISVIVGGCIGVAMAYCGYGVWALVSQAILGNVIWVIIMWILAKWCPGRDISLKSFRSLFSFGSKYMLSNLLHTVYTNMYSLVIGKFFNSSTLGYFNRAYTLGQFPVQNFGNVVQKVLYPIQCRYQDDNERFNQIFVTYLRMSSFILFPLMIGFAALATPVISLLLTEKWLPMVPLLQIICVALMWFPIMQANVSVLDAKGRSGLHLKSEIIKKVLAVLILVLTLPWGIRFVCLGLLLYSLVDMIVIIAFSRRLTHIGYRAHFKILMPALVLSLCMGAVVYGLAYKVDSISIQIIVGIIIGAAFYLLLAYVLKFPEFGIIRSFLKSRNNA